MHITYTYIYIIHAYMYTPYMAKCSRGKTFVVFMVFHSIANLFPQIMALSIGNTSLQACYSESFPVNNRFAL